MRTDVITADALAAVAAAYLVVRRREERATPPTPSRWQLAERLPEVDVRRVALATTRWNAAGRLDV
jgi:hypothetical protein